MRGSVWMSRTGDMGLMGPRLIGLVAALVVMAPQIGWADESPAIPLVFVEGSAEAQGRSIGKQFSKEVRQTTDFLLDTWAKGKLGWSQERIAAERAARIDSLPTPLRDELRGLAEGSGVPLDRLEAANAIPLTIPGGMAAVWGRKTLGDRLLVLQRFEAPAPFPVSPIQIVVRPEQGKPHTYVTWPGFIGALVGINSEGMTVATRDFPTREAGSPGVGPAFLARLILQNSKSITESASFLRKTNRQGAGILLIGDGKAPDAEVFEFIGGEMSRFASNDPRERADGFAPTSSAVRRGLIFADQGLAATAAKILDPAFSKLPASLDYEAFSRFVIAPEHPIGDDDCLELVRPKSANSVGVVINASEMRFDVEVAGKAPEHRNAYALLFPTYQGFDFQSQPERLWTGMIRPQPRQPDETLPEQFELDTTPFEFEMEPDTMGGGVLRYQVRFPSPLETPHPENNTIHAEYFRPFGTGPFPCIVMLHIAGGDFDLSRGLSSMLAQNGIGGLFIKLPYYGERRPNDGRIRMISNDLERGLTSMRQAVLDLRRAADWIEANPEVDSNRIGIMGVSLGAITGGLAAAIEPRFSHACLIMGGAALENILYDSSEPEAREFRAAWNAQGGTRESFGKEIAPFDAKTYGHRLRERVVLMVSAEHDEVIPRVSNDALWEATGQQKIIWYPCGHYTMARYLLAGMKHAVAFFKAWPDHESHNASPPRPARR